MTQVKLMIPALSVSSRADGHVRTLAEKMAEEVKASGAECTLLQIPEVSLGCAGALCRIVADQSGSYRSSRFVSPILSSRTLAAHLC